MPDEEFHYHFTSHCSRDQFKILSAIANDEEFKIEVTVKTDKVSEEDAEKAIKACLLSIFLAVRKVQ